MFGEGYFVLKYALLVTKQEFILVQACIAKVRGAKDYSSCAAGSARDKLDAPERYDQANYGADKRAAMSASSTVGHCI